MPFLNEQVPSELNTIFIQKDTVWLGTAKGVIRLLPAQMQKNNYAPPIYLTHINIAVSRMTPSLFFQRKPGLPVSHTRKTVLPLILQPLVSRMKQPFSIATS